MTSSNRNFESALDILMELHIIGHELPEIVSNNMIISLTRHVHEMVNNSRQRIELSPATATTTEQLTLQEPDIERPEGSEEELIQTPTTQEQTIPNTPPPVVRVRPSELLNQISTMQQLHLTALDALLELDRQPILISPSISWSDQWIQHKANNHKNRAIGRAKFESNCKEDCAICLDRHTIGESVITDCGHEFGNQCWETWMINPVGNHSCPSCRKHMPTTTSFKLRTDRQNINSEHFEGHDGSKNMSIY
jgi:hypothetical protein